MITETLTRREIEVLRLLALGCTYARIAEHLAISPHTVTTHIKNTYRKLDVHNAAGAVARAIDLRVLGAPGGSPDHGMGVQGSLAYDALGEGL